MVWRPRTSFDQVLSLEKFYSGGPIVPTHDGSQLVCFYNNRLSLLVVPSGRYTASIDVSDDGDMLTAMAIHPTTDKVLVTSRSGMMYMVDLGTKQVASSRKTSHGGVVTSIVFDPTGTLFATTSADKSVRVCDYKGMYDTHCFRDFTTICTKAMFLYDIAAPDSYLYLVTLSRSELAVHELHSKKLVGKITEHLSTILSFTLLDDYLISSGEDKVLILTQIANCQLKKKCIVNIHSSFTDMVVTGDSIVGPSSCDGEMLRFVLSECFERSQKRTEEYITHFAYVGMDLNCSKDLMNANNYFCAKYMGVPFSEDTVPGPDIERKHNSYVDVRDFLYTVPYPVGEVGGKGRGSVVHHFLISTTSDFLILLFDLTTMETVRIADCALPDPLSIAAYDELPRFRMLTVATICSDNGEVLDMKRVSSNEVAVGTSANQVRVLRYCEGSDDANIVSVLQNYSCYGHSNYITCLSSSVEASTFCTASKDGTVRLWQRLPISAQLNAAELYSMMSAPNAVTTADAPAIISYPLQMAITPWVCTAILEDAKSDIDCVVLSTEKRWFSITGAADKCLRVYDLSHFRALAPADMLSPKTIHPITTVLAHLDSLNHMALSPNQRQLATVSADLSLKLWGLDDLAHPQFLAELQKVAKRSIWSVDYSAYEKLLILACGDKKIRIVQISGKKNSADIKLGLFKTLEGHGNAVMRACFISHGQQALSVGADGLIKVWNIDTAECVYSAQNTRKIRDLGLDVDHLYGTESLRKMWGLISLDDGRGYITGDSDGVLRWYYDNTMEIEAKQKEAESLQILQREEVENVLLGDGLDKEAVIKGFRLALNMYTSIVNREKELQSTMGMKGGRSIKNADYYMQQIVMHVCDSDEQIDALAEAIETVGLIRVMELINLIKIWMRNGRLAKIGTTLLLALFRAYPVNVIVEVYGNGITDIITEITGLMQAYLRKLQLLRADSALIDMSYSYFSYKN